MLKFPFLQLGEKDAFTRNQAQEIWLTVGGKIIQALVIILVNLLWSDYQFLLSYACYEQYKA